MKLTPVIRKHIITLIIMIYVIYRFVDVGLTRPHNHLEDVRQGTPVSCDDGTTWFPAQYLAAPDVLEQCR